MINTKLKTKGTVLLGFYILIGLSSCTKNNATTTPAVSKPTVSTTPVGSITHNSALSGVTISSNGGASITTKGVCWSTKASPTINDDKTNDGTGTGSTTSALTGLNERSNYFVRAYATNSAGTSYGTELYFTTLNNTNFTIPCSPKKNSAKFNGVDLNYTSVLASSGSSSSDPFIVRASGSRTDMKMTFSETPTSGKYVITNKSVVSAKYECSVSGTFGFSLGYHYVAKENDTIYVKDKGNGVYTFDFCNLEFNSGSTTTNFTTDGNLTTQ
jgi:hypothetical protein